MKKQFLLLSAIAVFTACNDSNTNNNGSGDSTKTTTSTTTTATKGRQIANFATRTFMDLKTHQPVHLRWDTVYYYYVDESTGKEPTYYFYDPAAHDTFDYRGRVLNNAIISANGDYTIDESRVRSDEMLTTPDTTTTITTTTTTTTDGDTTTAAGKMKMKVKDDKVKIKKK